MSNGYDSVSVRQVAAKAKVHPSIPRYHFGSKENLWLETMKYLFIDIEEMMGSSYEYDLDKENPIDYLRAQTRIRVAHGAYKPAFIKILHAEVIYESERLHLIQDMLDKMHDSAIVFFEQLRSLGFASHLNMEAFSLIALNLLTAPFMSYHLIGKKLNKSKMEKLIDNHTELLVQFFVGK